MVSVRILGVGKEELLTVDEPSLAQSYYMVLASPVLGQPQKIDIDEDLYRRLYQLLTIMFKAEEASQEDVEVGGGFIDAEPSQEMLVGAVSDIPEDRIIDAISNSGDQV